MTSPVNRGEPTDGRAAEPGATGSGRTDQADGGNFRTASADVRDTKRTTRASLVARGAISAYAEFVRQRRTSHLRAQDLEVSAAHIGGSRRGLAVWG